MARIACLIITDGRPCLQETLRSAEEFLFPYIDGPTYIASDVLHKKGLSGNVTSGWSAADGQDHDWVFHLEDDWVFTEPVPVEEMAQLQQRECLLQVALKRNPVNPIEQAVGGFMEANPDNYEQRDGWVESFFGFTFNPCLVPCTVLDLPTEDGEAGLTRTLRATHYQGMARFGIYGNLDDLPRCFHIGHQRAEGWKL